METSSKVKMLAAAPEVQNLSEVNEEGDYTLTQVVRWLMPWYEKTGGEERIGDWEASLPLIMMKNLLKLWLTEEGMDKVDKVLHVYHPIDRAAMAYAVLVFILTGERMKFKKPLARQHFRVLCSELRDNMAELTFSNHMKYMLYRYGKKRVIKTKIIK